LAVGIAVCMMIFIIIQFQTSFDDFHSNKDRIYRVLTNIIMKMQQILVMGKMFLFQCPQD
jgi:type II secretory pathway component PulF